MDGSGHKVDGGGILLGGIFAFVTAITLNQWIAIFTLIYFIFQTFISLPKVIDTAVLLWVKYVRKQ